MNPLAVVVSLGPGRHKQIEKVNFLQKCLFSQQWISFLDCWHFNCCYLRSTADVQVWLVRWIFTQHHIHPHCKSCSAKYSTAIHYSISYTCMRNPPECCFKPLAWQLSAAIASCEEKELSKTMSAAWETASHPSRFFPELFFFSISCQEKVKISPGTQFIHVFAGGYMKICIFRHIVPVLFLFTFIAYVIHPITWQS